MSSCLVVSLLPGDNEPCLNGEWRLYRLATRLRTFSNWPFTEDCACTPERFFAAFKRASPPPSEKNKCSMAEAGFVHCPSDNSPDVVKCFFCLKELEGWEPEDDPMDEHKKHSPSCLFIALKKKAEELTLSEFLKLDLERTKIKMQKQMNLHIEGFQAKANEVRDHLEQLDADETQ